MGDSKIMFDKIYSIAKGDKSLVQDYINIFIEESYKDINDLKENAQNLNWEVIEIAAHNLKTRASYFGVDDLVKRALEIENLSQKKEVGKLNELIHEIEEHYNSTIASFTDHMN